jgi:hypothetical protein
LRRGHGQICGIISRRGGPEQIQAERKYKEAVAVAVEKCAVRNARAALRASETPASSAYDVADDEADDEARSL